MAVHTPARNLHYHGINVAFKRYTSILLQVGRYDHSKLLSLTRLLTACHCYVFIFPRNTLRCDTTYFLSKCSADVLKGLRVKTIWVLIVYVRFLSV